jgi:DNA-binding transcriptional ArsR family regulator
MTTNESDKSKRRRELHQAIEELLRANPKGLTASEIAFYLSIERRTVSKNLPTLDEAGILLWEDESGRLGILDATVLPPTIHPDLDKPIIELRKLLEEHDNEESKYQHLFQSYPWIFGTYYREIIRHQKFDDENIPDFLGIRAHDNFMDIFEIKAPFLKLYRNDGNFSSEFNDAWNQAERYLAFAQIEADYLRRSKSLLFNNPKCVLIVGYNLPEAIATKLSTKQRLNPLIQSMTYNQVLAQAETTVNFIKQLRI